MQDYLIFKGQIVPIENENAPEIYKANEWQKLDRIVRATIRMHLSESVYFTVQSYTIAFEHWKKLSKTYEKKGASITCGRNNPIRFRHTSTSTKA